MDSRWGWALVISGALLILVEVAFGGFAGFDLVLIGSAFLVGGSVGLLTHNSALGLIVAAVLCLAYIVAGRRWVRSRLKDRTVPSNADALLGERGLVVVRVAEHEPGQVRVRDEVWRALPASGAAGPYEQGAVVTVEEIDGVTLRVR